MCVCEVTEGNCIRNCHATGPSCFQHCMSCWELQAFHYTREENMLQQ